MAPYIGGFAQLLADKGYTGQTIRAELKAVGSLGRWLQAEQVEVANLTEEVIAGFYEFRRTAGYRKPYSHQTFRWLLEFLTTSGVVVPLVREVTAVDLLIEAYRSWLTDTRGLATPTVLRYESLARRFCEEQATLRGDDFLGSLSASDLTGFLLREANRVSVGAAKGRVAEVRSLSRFLYVARLTETNLAAAVPPVAGWRDTSVPKAVPSTHVDKMLAALDAEECLRDRAILTLVARLGLRSIEVSRLELGDIDWRSGELVVRGKARRQDKMPMPTEVGEVISAYLLRARPSTESRRVFMTSKAPIKPIRADLVSDVARRACERAGIRRVGAHRLRHSLATEMLRRGVTLPDISQVLRHSDLATTAIYAKVDIEGLRSVVQPWPGTAK